MRGQSFITLDFQGLKFQPRCEEKLEPVVQLSTACQIREILRRTRSPRSNLPPFSSCPISPSQVINGKRTPRHNMAMRGIRTSCCDMSVLQTNLSVGMITVFSVVRFMIPRLFSPHSLKTLMEGQMFPRLKRSYGSLKCLQ